MFKYFLIALTLTKWIATKNVDVNISLQISQNQNGPPNRQRFCPVQEKCDERTASKIVGGCEVKDGSFPWQVAIATKKEGGFCGGTIICKKYVLTAAHCLQDPKCDTEELFPGACKYNACAPSRAYRKKLRVHVGKHHYDINEDKIAAVHKVKRLHLHPVYTSIHKQCPGRRSLWDYAVVRLKKSIKFDVPPFKNPPAAVYLPGPRDDEFQVGNGRLVVSGWGRRSMKPLEDEPCIGDVLNAVNLYPLKNSFHLCREPPQSLCASKRDNSASSCYGDSGGPLVYLDRVTNKVKLVGVVARAGQKNPYKTCGGPDAVAVFERVTAILSKYSPWYIGNGRRMATILKKCNWKACKAGNCVTGKTLDKDMKKFFFDPLPIA